MESDKHHRPGLRMDRRKFLSSATAAGVTTLVSAGKTEAEQRSDQTAPATEPPDAAQLQMEYETPEGYSADQAQKYFVSSPGSDFMVDVIKKIGIDYIPTNPGSSFRGIHESIVNYGGNKAPELLTTLHEEQATAMAHGYYKVSGKPLMPLVHGTVGLQHASMAVYNAWSDRVPMIILAGNHMNVTDRRAGAEWAHSAQDCIRVVRDYIKWDDQPVSLQHFAESMARAWKIAMTPPRGPVAIAIDGHLQEAERGDLPLQTPRISLTQPPIGDEGAVAEAARMLVEAENPVIVADLMAHDQIGIERLIELAEALQAPVVNQGGRMNFPSRHHLSQGSHVVAKADVILCLELNDTWGTINTMRDRVHREAERRARQDATVIDIGVKDLFIKSNYQNFQRYFGADLSIAGDGQATLPSLTEAVRSAMTRSRRSSNSERESMWRAEHKKSYEQTLDAARYAWDASPISVARLFSEIWQIARGREWSLVSDDHLKSNWGRRLWPMSKHHHYLGRSGAGGVGYGAPAAVGAALALRDSGILPINVQADGDMMYSPGAFWTAAHHNIPLLTVTHNNLGYHQENMHLQRMSARRQRGTDGNSLIGNELRNPEIDLAQIAGGMGVWSEGPIHDPKDLGPALLRAMDVIDQGEPAFIDCQCQPR